MSIMEFAILLKELQENNPDGYELVVKTVQRLREKQLKESE